MPYPHGLQVSAARLGLGLSAHITAATMQLHQTIEKMARRDSFIRSRLALLQLISEVAEHFKKSASQPATQTSHTATAEDLKKSLRAVLVERLARQ
jgi:isopentenyl phosphate kinase